MGERKLCERESKREKERRYFAMIFLVMHIYHTYSYNVISSHYSWLYLYTLFLLFLLFHIWTALRSAFEHVKKSLHTLNRKVKGEKLHKNERSRFFFQSAFFKRCKETFQWFFTPSPHTRFHLCSALCDESERKVSRENPHLNSLCCCCDDIVWVQLIDDGINKF